MSIIRPISDLRNRANMISKICHEQAEPVFITKNGQGDLVVMSQAYFDQQQAMMDLYRKLDEAEEDAKTHSKGIPHEQLMKKLKSRLKS